MKITIENTDRLVTLNGVPARIWEGNTDSGFPVVCFITRIAMHEDQPASAHEQFERELRSTRKLSPEASVFDARMVL